MKEESGDVAAAELDLVYSQTPVALAASSTVAVILWWLLRPHAGAPLDLWVVLLLGSNLARMGLWMWRRSARERHHPRFWRRLFVMGAFLSGALWGALGPFLDLSWPLVEQITLLLALAGVATGSIPSNAAVPAACYAFLVPTLVPLEIHLGLMPVPGTGGLLLLVVLFALGLLVSAFNTWRFSHRAFVLAEERRRLVGNLEAEVNDRRHLTRRLEYQASHDGLTGLANRREFERRLAQTLANVRKEGGTCLCLYLDLDQFKVVNDTCGHGAGDELLRQVATLLAAGLRRSDLLARLGGDEFGVLLEGCLLDQGREIAEALVEAVREFRFVWGDKSFDIGVSIGMVPVESSATDIAEVLSNADLACYTAKERGRSRVHVYRTHDRHLAARRGEMQWVARIDQALNEGRMRLHGQIILPLSPGKGRSPHLEFLVRMEDSEGGIVPPNAFLPAAERYGAMPRLDRWVVEQAFAWCAAQGDSEFVCALNLSGTSLSDPGMLDFLRAQLQACTLPPGRICFEITETAAVSDMATAKAFIDVLRDLGCRFALDDFGSGLSSFGYLKALPVDYLKIDGEFVRDMAHDPVDRTMVESINHLGHVMGMETIAEFVEDTETLEILRGLGVDYVQGQGIAPALPLAQIFGTREDPHLP